MILANKLENLYTQMDEIEKKLEDITKDQKLVVWDRVVIKKMRGYVLHPDGHYHFFPSDDIDNQWTKEYMVIELEPNQPKRNICGESYLDYLKNQSDDDEEKISYKTKEEFEKEACDIDICIVDSLTKIKIFTKQEYLCKTNDIDDTTKNTIKQCIQDILSIENSLHTYSDAISKSLFPDDNGE